MQDSVAQRRLLDTFKELQANLPQLAAAPPPPKQPGCGTALTGGITLALLQLLYYAILGYSAIYILHLYQPDFFPALGAVGRWTPLLLGWLLSRFCRSETPIGAAAKKKKRA